MSHLETPKAGSGPSNLRAEPFGILNFNEFPPFLLRNRSNQLQFYYFCFVEWFARMLHIWEFVCWNLCVRICVLESYL
jgi:hypothetical protein